ncbi:MAG: hypothetical protein GYB36_12330 [Alphaproteobacteria bacterium]|nr:hypothetical protein [Alphaproteobacteria bacterium]
MGLRIIWAAVLGMAIIFMMPNAAVSHPPAEHTPPTEESVEPEADAAVEPPADATGEVEHQHGQLEDVAGHAHVDAADPCVDDGHHEGAASPAGGHAHWGEDGASTPFERAMSRIGVFHSFAVHFPIALILAAALAQGLVLAGRFATGSDTVRYLVWTGAAGGVAAGLLGWAHSGPMGADEAGVMLAHRLLGTALLFGLVGLAALGEWSRRPDNQLGALIFNVALFGSALALLLNGFLGGALAHGGLRHLFGGG